MPKDKIAAKHFSPDTLDFLKLLARFEARYVIVGGEAVIYYGFARLTGDIDIYYDRSASNAEKMFAALDAFWNHNIPGNTNISELQEEGLIIQYGVPPNRIDLINKVSGLEFNDAWMSKTTVEVVDGENRVQINYIGIHALIRNKRASARPKDIEDLGYLEKL